MSNITVTVRGREAVVSAMQSVLDTYKAKINDAIQGAGIDTQAGAKQACPVDTGRLRASIQYVPGDFSCQVGTNVFYGIFIEMGTVKMAARPYLYPAFRKSIENLKAELQAI